MPIKRRMGKERREGASGEAWAFMLDEPMPEGGNPFRWLAWGAEIHRLSSQPLAPFGIQELWQTQRNEVLAEWTEHSPGTRPRCWWAWDAPRQPTGTHPGCWYDGLLPELRQRVGGIGTPLYHVLAYAPDFRFGIPAGWVTDAVVESYAGTSFAGFAISNSDPPRFEAQASYLERHRLLLPGERRRLTETDFALEPIWVDCQTDG